MNHDFSILKAFMITVAYILIDAQYATYTMLIQKQRAFAAALVASLMYALMAYGIIAYTSEPIYVIFVSIGSFIGTYLAIRINIWHSNKIRQIK